MLVVTRTGDFLEWSQGDLCLKKNLLIKLRTILIPAEDRLQNLCRYIVRDIQSALKGKLCLRPCSDPALPEFLPDCGIAALPYSFRKCSTRISPRSPKGTKKGKKMPYVMYMYICF